MASSAVAYKWRSAVMIAVMQNDVNQFHELMKSKQSLNFCFTGHKRAFYNATTPLFLAIIMDNPKFARDLLCAGADVHFADETGRTPLMRTVQYNNVPMFRLLVSYGASVHAVPGFHSQMMDLYAAADHKLEAAVLDNGVKIPQYSHTLKNGSPIGAAIYYEKDDIVKHILEHCSDMLSNRLPLGLLFNWALAAHSPRSAIILLQHGYRQLGGKRV